MVDDPDIWRAADLSLAAAIATEMARTRGPAFDSHAVALVLCRAAEADADFRIRLAEVYWRLDARRATKIPANILAPIPPLFGDLEREAEQILGRP